MSVMFFLEELVSLINLAYVFILTDDVSRFFR